MALKKRVVECLEKRQQAESKTPVKGVRFNDYNIPTKTPTHRQTKSATGHAAHCVRGLTKRRGKAKF